MATYILKSGTSDLSGGADFDRDLSTGTESAGSLSPSIAAASTEVSYSYTVSGVPNSNDWATATISVELNITTGNSKIFLTMSASRLNSAGVVQETSGNADEQRINQVKIYDFTIPAYDWGSAGDPQLQSDRLRINYSFRNSDSMAAQAATFDTGTINCEHVTSIIEDQFILKFIKSMPVEWLLTPGILNANHGIPVEWTGIVTVNQNQEIPIEWEAAVGGISQKQQMPVEFLSTLAQNQQIVTEFLSSMSKIEQIIIENIVPSSSSHRIIAEFLSSLSKNEEISVEWTSAGVSFSQNQGVPIEWLFTFNTNREISIEWYSAFIYFLSKLSPDLSGGNDFDARLLTTTAAANVYSISVDFGDTDISFAYTDRNVPANTDWETGTLIITIKRLT